MPDKKLYKISREKKICGVCGGIAEYLGIDVTIVRLIWAAVTFFTGCVAGTLLYIVCAFIMPEDTDGGDGNVFDGESKEL